MRRLFIKFFIHPLFLFIWLGVYASAHASDGEYSNIYIFGDSLSDQGNLASIIGDLPPPYYENRISNGPVAVETLASHLGLTSQASAHLLGLDMGNNYAVSGATSAGDTDIDLTRQIIAFQVNHGFIAADDALYVIFIGGNDLRRARDTASLDESINLIHSAVANITKAIESLKMSGAESFLVINPPNIGIIPETQILAAQTSQPGLVKKSRKLSKLYRSVLHKNLKRIENIHEDIEIIEFDLFKFFNKLVRNAEDYGFTNTTQACFSTFLQMPFDHCLPDLDFDSYLFFDEIHPTRNVHSIIGNALYEQVSSDLDGDDPDGESDENEDDD